jgi:hypothetical protein
MRKEHPWESSGEKGEKTTERNGGKEMAGKIFYRERLNLPNQTGYCRPVQDVQHGRDDYRFYS